MDHAEPAPLAPLEAVRSSTSYALPSSTPLEAIRSLTSYAPPSSTPLKAIRSSASYALPPSTPVEAVCALDHPSPRKRKAVELAIQAGDPPPVFAPIPTLDDESLPKRLHTGASAAAWSARRAEKRQQSSPPSLGLVPVVDCNGLNLNADTQLKCDGANDFNRRTWQNVEESCFLLSNCEYYHRGGLKKDKTLELTRRFFAQFAYRQLGYMYNLDALVQDYKSPTAWSLAQKDHFELWLKVSYLGRPLYQTRANSLAAYLQVLHPPCAPYLGRSAGVKGPCADLARQA
jgi:hypothetical protein